VLVDLAAVDLHRLLAARRREEPGVEALRRELGRDPARHQDQLRQGDLEAGLLARFAHRRVPRRRDDVAVAGRGVVFRIDAASREHPGSAVKIEPRVAADEQHLAAFGRVGPVAQQNHRCRRVRGRRGHSSPIARPAHSCQAGEK
jgi:hypothetical protein